MFKYDVFLSHSSCDKLRALELVERLKADGVRVWIYEAEIKPGDIIGLEIEQALQASRTVVLLMSVNAIDSKWVAIEQHTAVFRDPTNEARRFIPVRLDDVSFSDFLSQFSWIDWRTKHDDEYRKLLDAVRTSTVPSPSILVDQIDPEWKQKLDRRDQTGAAAFIVDEMLEHGRPRCICFCWYGGRHDGVDVFHNRLDEEFAKRTRHRYWSVRPEWPALVNRRSFCEMLAHALSVPDVSAIGSAIRKQIQERRRQVLYVNHVPVESHRQLSPFQFLEYLRWWDEAVLDFLESQQHVVLGVSFVVKDSTQFREAIEQEAKIPSHAFSDAFVFESLPVLAQLQPEHLRNFFKRINMQLRLDQQHVEKAIRIILDSTKGEYDQVVKELEVLIVDGFSKFESQVADRKRKSAEWGY